MQKALLVACVAVVAIAALLIFMAKRDEARRSAAMTESKAQYDAAMKKADDYWANESAANSSR